MSPFDHIADNWQLIRRGKQMPWLHNIFLAPLRVKFKPPNKKKLWKQILNQTENKQKFSESFF